MRRLTRSLPFCAAVLALALAAPAVRAQALDAASSQPAPTRLVAEAAAPLPRTLTPPATRLDEARTSTISQAIVEDVATSERRRSGWKYPLIGMAVGAVVGAGFGTWVMLDAEEWLAPPAHIATVPAG
ncbi:MAG TPA: hypothetical protein VFY65_04945, partial [Longimicrobium sp.]|nr:hypothetical protein [Longimicrobium sp.]